MKPDKAIKQKIGIDKVLDDLFDKGYQIGLWQGLTELRTICNCLKMQIQGTEQTKKEYSTEYILKFAEEAIQKLEKRQNE